MERIYLILENGDVFEGESFGASGEVTGELVFTTGMTGYLETISDPSYYGQLVVQTFPLIGNYGVIPSDFECSKPGLFGYVTRRWCDEPSNFRSEGDLDKFLKDRGIIGLCGIDTRALTKLIRERGVMNARISKRLENRDEAVKEIKNFEVRHAVRAVTCGEAFSESCLKPAHRVVLWDFGAKKSIRKNLIKRNCEVITVPSFTTALEIEALKPDGIMLSNGPGDPAENTEIIKEIAKLTGSGIPVFGICLGHQLLALAQGGRTMKLKYGHRGANQPVKQLETGRVYITSQNHGYAVVMDDLPANARASFVNANDGTCEGIDYTGIRAFSVQFHPEASAGPKDSEFLFDRFIEMMGGVE